MLSRGKPIILALLCLAFASLPAGQAMSEGLELSGSISHEAGKLGLRDDIPDAAAADWYSLYSARARLKGGDETGRFSAAIGAGYDAVTSAWELSLNEAWAELSPASFASLRLGRFPLRYGPCLAFNPANSLVQRDCLDASSGERGLDGAALRFRPLAGMGGKAPYLGLDIEAALFLPSGDGSTSAILDLEESSAHARLSCYLPGAELGSPVELGLSGDARRIGLAAFGGTASSTAVPMEAGAWLSADIAGFTLGAEACARSSGYRELSEPGATAQAVDGKTELGYALSLNRSLGDFLAIVEGSYESQGDEWQGFGRLSWAGEDLELSLAALVDFSAPAARTALELSWNAGDALVLRARGLWNYRPESWAPALAACYAARLSLECFF